MKTDAQPARPPVLLLCAGGAGGGKTTLLHWLAQHYPLKETHAITFDKFQDGAGVNLNRHFHDEKTGANEASFLALREQLFRAALAEGGNILVETHLDHPKQLGDFIAAARARSYRVELHGVVADPETFFHLRRAEGKIDGQTPLSMHSQQEFLYRWRSHDLDAGVCRLYERRPGSAVVPLVGKSGTQRLSAIERAWDVESEALMEPRHAEPSHSWAARAEHAARPRRMPHDATILPPRLYHGDRPYEELTLLELNDLLGVSQNGFFSSTPNAHEFMAALRGREGLTRTEMAPLLGIAPENLKSYEMGDTLPTSTTLEHMRYPMQRLPQGQKIWGRWIDLLVENRLVLSGLPNRTGSKNADSMPREYWLQVLRRTNNPQAWAQQESPPPWATNVPACQSTSDYLLAYRQALALPEKLVSDATHCNQSTVSRVERGRERLRHSRHTLRQYYQQQEGLQHSNGQLSPTEPPLFSPTHYARLENLERPRPRSIG